MPSLLEQIKAKSRELGFIDLGIARATVLHEELRRYEQWLSEGCNATMAWMEKNLDKRRDVSLIVPNAKSVIVTAFNYNTNYMHPAGEALTANEGKISRYAWNYDYHEVLKPKLAELSAYLRELVPSSESRHYTDTGPILEKVWAERAGIGWQGKNSLVLSKKFGSYFFIGIIITTAELEPSERVKDCCMSCRKCIDACPTGAIVADKVVDSRLCLSYQTIESPRDKALPDEITEKLSGWIFGCDICQEVCPWNRNLPPHSDDERFHPRHGETVLKLDSLLNMSQEEFSTRFTKSPIKRPKLAGMKRNAEALKRRS